MFISLNLSIDFSGCIFTQFYWCYLHIFSSAHSLSSSFNFYILITILTLRVTLRKQQRSLVRPEIEHQHIILRDSLRLGDNSWRYGMVWYGRPDSHRYDTIWSDRRWFVMMSFRDFVTPIFISIFSMSTFWFISEPQYLCLSVFHFLSSHLLILLLFIPYSHLLYYLFFSPTVISFYFYKGY